MKRFALVASASLALLVGACDDDSPPKRDGGTDVRPEAGAEVATEGGVPGMCVGTFAQLNRTSLGALVKADGMCKAGTDLDLICSSDIGGTIRRDYAAACLGTVAGGPAAVVACINSLAKRDFPALSDACLGCYSNSVACTLDKCFDQCVPAATSAACSTCQTAQGCLSAFFSCSGLPGGPTTPPADGGTDTSPDTGTSDAGVDAPAADAPAADTAADTATDSSAG